MENIYIKIQKNTKVIFISSTSVYGKDENNYDESFSLNESLVSYAEKQVEYKTSVIFRCAGLMGYDRIPGKYFSSKTLTYAKEKTNYVHRDDVIRAILFVIDNKIKWIYNLCSSEHFDKKDIYDFNALKHNYKKSIFKVYT
ncbi:MAG: hypothetical protein HRT40_03355 [Campylobacteraceae bacterium]|nr:hypothetical protein [Campylobacteraceae bacterium]